MFVEANRSFAYWASFTTHDILVRSISNCTSEITRSHMTNRNGVKWKIFHGEMELQFHEILFRDLFRLHDNMKGALLMLL